MGARFAVVDYHKGNLASVQRGLSDAGFNAVITDDAAAIRSADGIVLPGVGAFADAMATMNEMGQADAIRAAVSGSMPWLSSTSSNARTTDCAQLYPFRKFCLASSPRSLGFMRAPFAACPRAT